VLPSVAVMPQRPITLIACLAAAVTIAGCGGAHNDSKSGGKPAAQPTVLRLANFNGDPGIVQFFADEVARASHGTLRITFDNAPHGADPDGEQETIRDVQQGRAALGATGARAFDSAGIDDFQALVAPFLISSYAQQQQVLQSDVAKRMLASLRRVKLTGVAVLPGPMRRMLGVKKSYRAVSDFAGTRIGLNRSKVGAATLHALGATPVDQTVPAQLTGLDGLETSYEYIAGNGFDRTSRSVTENIALWPRPIVIFANPRALRPLSSKQRQALLEAGLRVLPATTNATAATDREGAAQLCRSGFKLISATPAALRDLRAAVQPVYASLNRNVVTRGYVSEIGAMSSTTATPQDPTCSGRSASQGPRPKVASPLDGVYRMSASAAAVAKADGVPTSQATPENYGDFVLVIDRGRFAMTQSNAKACTWGYGKAGFNSGRMDWVYTDGGGNAPTGAANKPGEHFVFQSTLYRGTLKLAVIIPADFPYPPARWHQISATPRAAALSRRCPPPATALTR
jgi:TRAP-type transport system periplasmic protein